MRRFFVASSLLYLLLIFCACSLPRQSAIITKGIKIGMTKSDVINRIGRPYKIAIKNDNSGNTIEALYFKETIFPKKAANAYDIESILNFNKDILVSIAQGNEKKSGGESAIINNTSTPILQ